MNADPNLFKQLTESYESLKSHLPASYTTTEPSEDFPEGQGYAAQSPEPEQFDYQGNFTQQEDQKGYYAGNKGSNANGSSSYRGSSSSQQSGSSRYNSNSNASGSNLRGGFQRRPYDNNNSSSKTYGNGSRQQDGSFTSRKPFFKQGASSEGGQFNGNSSSSSSSNSNGTSSRFQGAGPNSFSGGSNSAGGFNRQMRPGFTSNNNNNNNFQGGDDGHGGYHIAGTKVFVNNIEPHIHEEDISHFFGAYGKINDLKVFHRADQHYAYVIYDRYEDAFSASNDSNPNPSWNVSLAKSKNTVMQYQQSSMYSNVGGNTAGSSTTASSTNANSSTPSTNTSFRGSVQKSYGNNSAAGSGESNFQGGDSQQPQGYRKQQMGRNYNNGYSSKFNNNNNDYGYNNNNNQSQINPQSEVAAIVDENGQIISGDSEKFPADSHLTNILNNCRNTNQLVDLMMMPTDRMESLAANKTQINQTILVREIWISSIDETCSTIIREVIEDNFGPVEEIEFFGKKEQSFAFVKFYMVKTAFDAFSNKDRISELLETEQVKLTYSDPSRRRNIIGDHKEYMKDENLSPVLYVSFPFGFKVSKQVILKIASDYGTVLNATVKRSDDPKQTSSVLIEFKDLKDTKFAYENMREDHERMNPKCEYAILLNSEKFIKENNLKLKDKTKDPNHAQNFNNMMQRNMLMINQYNNSNLFHNNQYRRNHNNNMNNNNNNNNNNNMYMQQQQQPYQQNFRQPDQYSRSNNRVMDTGDSYLNGKRKLDSLVNQTEEFYANETTTPEAEPHEALAMEEDDDDDNFIWSGFISVLSKGRCGMDAKLIHSSGTFELDNHNLNMTTKVPIQDALKATPYAVIILKPSSDTSMKPFADVKAFLNTSPRESGVISTRSFTIYLLPNCEEAQEICPTLKEHNILALCLARDSSSSNAARSKKDQKIDDKAAAKQSSRSHAGESSQTSSSSQPQQYDPTKAFAAISSIVATKPTSGGASTSTPPPNGSASSATAAAKIDADIQPEEDDQEDEDMYDPNEITTLTNNINSTNNNHTDLSELIDNPNLVDDMLKSIN